MKLRNKRVMGVLLAAVLFAAGCGKGGTATDADISGQKDNACETEIEASETDSAKNSSSESTEIATETSDEVSDAGAEEPDETQESETETTDNASEELRPEFKEAMDAYEAFYDDYCELMKQYKENPTDMGLLAKYTEMLTKLSEMDESFKAWDEDEMNSAELQYYMDVNARVVKKMAEVAQ